MRDLARPIRAAGVALERIGRRTRSRLMNVTFRPLPTALLAASCLLTCACSRAADTATLTVRVDQPGVKISPLLYGIFFEEINCAGDGGLYAELVRNRSFEDADKPDHWSLVTTGAAQGEMTLDTARPLNPLNRHSLRLNLKEAKDGAVRLVNAGYWGIAVAQGAEYQLSLSARAADGFKGPLSITLEGKDGTVHAHGTIAGLEENWKRFEATLKAAATDPAAQLVISAGQPGTVWLDMVSLAPRRTWQDRSNGLRPDLGRLLEDLRPAFVRFPGGCWVEGEELKTSYRWKETIGEIGLRRTQWNLWQYSSGHGLGFLEYLILCEDLGAEPLFVINCGMSHREVVPMDQMGQFVQDALDALEYANGPTNSVWGALRARHGHPAPFGLKHLEIGNENGGPAYHERFALFHDAIKARYPDVRLVANEWGGSPKNRPIDIIDEHYYSSAEFFMGQAHRYDRYDRNGPKVYVGEYAVTQGCGQGNLRAALGEAAFMTGMERNSDVVVMASYAPLFANVNYKKWNPDLINFDSSRAYGIPSYYVQKMFGEQRGDRVLPVTLEVPLPPEPPVKRGKIGLGTWLTQAEYKDVKVTQGDHVLFASSLASDAKDWTAVQGDWQVRGGAYQQTSLAADQRAVAGDAAWSDYVYSLKARKLRGAEGFLIMFQVQDQDNWVWWNLGGWGNVRHALEQCQRGGKAILGNEVAGQIEAGRWYDIRVELKGQNIRCYLDGQLLHDVTYPRPEPLYATASLAAKSGEVILKVVNVTAGGLDTTVSLEGLKQLAAPARAVVLTSPDLDDENSLKEPRKVAPVEREFSPGAPRFQHLFPAYSVSVLRLQPER
jgi:alpha-L-arabinofuranosidase